ncbi:hypothetical protein HMPREF6745_2743 [Prevotella sp. oral taxon 472 str. F0295]|nr:hypothetical protein HMPREF6745_2743 [Prevotella sp. oral taxon 472 str. F0295]
MFNPQSFIRQLIYHFILIAWLPVIFCLLVRQLNYRPLSM